LPFCGFNHSCVCQSCRCYFLFNHARFVKLYLPCLCYQALTLVYLCSLPHLHLAFPHLRTRLATRLTSPTTLRYVITRCSSKHSLLNSFAHYLTSTFLFLTSEHAWLPE
jgi:hypothetical protein